jgi:RNA-directed DNA polymerase
MRLFILRRCCEPPAFDFINVICVGSTKPLSGSPQGGIISPVLANIYLHYALDLEFEKKVKPRMKGRAMMIRYADDFVCAFQFAQDAEGFYKVLPKRLKKFNLDVAEDKTSLMRFSRFHIGRKRHFVFLGFEFYWGGDSKGKARLRRRTAVKKQKAMLSSIINGSKLNAH